MDPRKVKKPGVTPSSTPSCPLDLTRLIPPQNPLTDFSDDIAFLSEFEDILNVIRNRFLANTDQEGYANCESCVAYVKSVLEANKDSFLISNIGCTLRDLVIGLLKAPSNLGALSYINTIVLMANIFQTTIAFAENDWETYPLACIFLLYVDPVLLSSKAGEFDFCTFLQKIDPANSVVTVPVASINVSSLDPTKACSVNTCSWLSSFDAHSNQCPSIVKNYINMDVSDVQDFIQSLAEGIALNPGDAPQVCGQINGDKMHRPLRDNSIPQTKLQASMTNLIKSMNTCCKQKNSITQKKWLQWLIIGIAFILCCVLVWIVFELFKKLSSQKAPPSKIKTTIQTTTVKVNNE